MNEIPYEFADPLATIYHQREGGMAPEEMKGARSFMAGHGETAIINPDTFASQFPRRAMKFGGRVETRAPRRHNHKMAHISDYCLFGRHELCQDEKCTCIHHEIAFENGILADAERLCRLQRRSARADSLPNV